MIIDRNCSCMNSGDRCYERLLFIHETCWSSNISWSLLITRWKCNSPFPSLASIFIHFIHLYPCSSVFIKFYAHLVPCLCPCQPKLSKYIQVQVYVLSSMLSNFIQLFPFLIHFHVFHPVSSTFSLSIYHFFPSVHDVQWCSTIFIHILFIFMNFHPSHPSFYIFINIWAFSYIVSNFPLIHLQKQGYPGTCLCSDMWK